MNVSQGSNRDNQRLKETMNELSEILSSEGQEELSERNERVKNLLSQLEEEVKRITQEIGYDYSNYEERLIQPDEYIEEEKERLLEEELELGAIREELLGMFEGNMKEILQRKLFREYLEDLVYESMKGKKKRIKYTSKINFAVELNTTEKLNSHLNYCRQNGKFKLDLGSVSLNLVLSEDSDEFVEWIEKAGRSGIKTLDLGGNYLYTIFFKLREDELNEIRKEISVNVED